MTDVTTATQAGWLSREEMDAAGALELLMPALQPIELWQESGRYATFGDLLMKLTLSGHHEMALGPTHEEVITDVVRDLIRGGEGDKSALAKQVGALVAERAKAAGVEAVVFDRGGNQYAGRIAALADAAREAGLKF